MEDHHSNPDDNNQISTMTTINIRSILLGIYIAASIATTVLANDETKPKKTRTRRLRRASNVVKVDGIEEGDRSREEQIAAIENINRILARSDDDEARSTNKKKNRQLIQAGIVENMNRKPVLSEVDVMKIMAKEIQWAQGTFQMSMPVSRGGVQCKYSKQNAYALLTLLFEL